MTVVNESTLTAAATEPIEQKLKTNIHAPKSQKMFFLLTRPPEFVDSPEIFAERIPSGISNFNYVFASLYRPPRLCQCYHARYRENVCDMIEPELEFGNGHGVSCHVFGPGKRA